MTKSLPLISVVMPVYNADRYLREAVESILNQTCRDFEFLIVDDGSTDGSLTILQEYAAQDDRIRLISRPNTGYVVALNEMLRLAQGEYIARMDADDISESNRFEVQLAFLETRSEHVAIGTRVLLIDPEGCPIREFREEMSHAEVDDAHLNHCTGAVICHPVAMIRRSAMEAIGLYRPDTMPAEDVDLFLRLAEIGRLRILPDVLLRYRLHHDSVSMSRRSEQLSIIQQVAADARMRRGMTTAPAASSSDQEPIQNNAGRHCIWAWWALAAGNISVARKHAVRACLLAPLSVENWRCLACVIRGH